MCRSRAVRGPSKALGEWATEQAQDSVLVWALAEAVAVGAMAVRTAAVPTVPAVLEGSVRAPEATLVLAHLTAVAAVGPALVLVTVGVLASAPATVLAWDQAMAEEAGKASAVGSLPAARLVCP